ncbi:hypothetical protein H0R90_10435 [Treponema putidum]|uniref:hypothetical protein n=1 Tax=Treponema putidum TaxID=221027 RepID=UPI0004F62A97|nr:hypothetical protein [Treponema putidum]AIN92711.1 hypothetical protein JO40_00020 [Treponema putidum]TWI75284.1 hypothetical protein JM98_02051 [Treponema putidum]
MKTCRKIILFALTLSFVFVFSCKTNENKISPAKNNGDLSKYELVAEAATKQCPVMLDEITRLDSVQYNAKEHALVYSYSIMNIKKSDIPANTVDLTLGMMRDAMLSGLKGQAALDMFRKDKVKLVYVFKDKEGKELFVFDFKHTEY